MVETEVQQGYSVQLVAMAAHFRRVGVELLLLVQDLLELVTEEPPTLGFLVFLVLVEMEDVVVQQRLEDNNLVLEALLLVLDGI